MRSSKRMVFSMVLFILMSLNIVQANTHNIPLNKDNTRSIDARIINGTQVSEEDESWRFIVALKYNGRQFCAGSLISPTWVVTAAHCIRGYDPEGGDTIGVGSYNKNETIDYKVKQWIVHPSYDSDSLDNDIALIELEKSALDTTNVSPIVYDTSHALESETETKVAGWGYKNANGYDAAIDLMEVYVPIVDPETCNDAYDGTITSNMICAGFMEGGKDSCQGDSGGPLVVEGKLTGIVSWGRGCAQKDYPGVYTKIQNYSEWIENFAHINDAVIGIKGPKKIKLGQSVTLDVDYVASEDRTLAVYLITTTGKKKLYFYKRITVHAGDEVEQVSFIVPDNAPTDATYKYGSYIAPLGKYYKDHLGKAYQYGVKVADAGNSPLTREELIQLIKNWANDPSQCR